MTDISAFPTITDAAWVMGNTITCTSSGTIDIVPGMVLCINATGVSMTVEASVAASGSFPVGVALTAADVSAGELVTVMTTGVAYLAQADDTATLDAGDFCITNDNAVGGTISGATLTATGTALAIVVAQVVGVTLDDIAASGTGRVLLTPGNTYTRANSS